MFKNTLTTLTLFGLALTGFGAVLGGCAQEAPMTQEMVDKWQDESLYGITVNSLAGTPTSLDQYDGYVCLIVNTASECGFTPQYSGLQALYEKYKDQNFVVLGFPSNDFGGQEPGSADEIQQFCSNEFGVTFPMFEKVVVNDGEDQSPVYQFLGTKTGKLPGWNFSKYLVHRDGKTVEFFNQFTGPDDQKLREAIVMALKASPQG